MSYKKVTAIFDQIKLTEVENALKQHSNIGFTIHSVEGKGTYVDLYNINTLSTHIQMDIYTNQDCALQVAKIIIDAAHSNSEDEGLVVISDIDTLFSIHTKQQVSIDELKL
ncbi:hypothetical protein MT391_07705 [Vibrio sp. 1-Bac 57]